MDNFGLQMHFLKMLYFTILNEIITNRSLRPKK